MRNCVAGFLGVFRRTSTAPMPRNHGPPCVESEGTVSTKCTLSPVSAPTSLLRKSPIVVDAHVDDSHADPELRIRADSSLGGPIPPNACRVPWTDYPTLDKGTPQWDFPHGLVGVGIRSSLRNGALSPHRLRHLRDHGGRAPGFRPIDVILSTSPVVIPSLRVLSFPMWTHSPLRRRFGSFRLLYIR